MIKKHFRGDDFSQNPVLLLELARENSSYLQETSTPWINCVRTITYKKCKDTLFGGTKVRKLVTMFLLFNGRDEKSLGLSPFISIRVWNGL